MESLEEIRAKYALDILSSDELVRGANSALDSGVYSDSLAELALTKSPIMSDVGPLFEAALAELGLPLFTPKDAALSLIERYTTAILHATLSPEQGTSLLYEVITVKNQHLIDDLKKVFGETGETVMWPMVALSDYNDIGAGELPESVKPEVDNSVIEQARSWHLALVARTAE